MPSLDDYSTAKDLVFWATIKLRIHHCPRDDADIKQIIRWIGFNAMDTIYPDGRAIFGRIAIGLMLTVTLLEFPEYFAKYELAQFN